MSDGLANEVVRSILADPELVALLRDALAPAGDATIGHHEAARRWGVKPDTVAGWCRDGLIVGRKVGRVWLVDPAAQRPKRERPKAPQPAPLPVAHRSTRRRPERSSVGAALRGD